MLVGENCVILYPNFVWRGNRYEGYPSFYHKEDIEVTMDNGEAITGMAYIMNQQAVPGIPSKSYVRTIMEGYLDNNLNLGYLECFLSAQ